MKDTFIVNENFLDNLSEKLFNIYGIDDFDYEKCIAKRFKKFPTKFFAITDARYILQAHIEEYIIKIFFVIYKNYKTNNEICLSIDLEITNENNNETYCLDTSYELNFKSDFNEFGEEEVIKYIIEIIQLYIDAVIEKKEEKQEEFKEKFYMEEK